MIGQETPYTVHDNFGLHGLGHWVNFGPQMSLSHEVLLHRMVSQTLCSLKGLQLTTNPDGRGQLKHATRTVSESPVIRHS